MKFAYPDFVNTLSWDALHPASLVLEYPQNYLQIVADLTAQVDGGEGNVIFSENGELISPAKSALLVRDLWSVDVNQKKLLNGVLHSLKQISQEEYYEETQELLQNMMHLVEQLAQDAMLPLVWEDTPDVSVIFKALGVHLDTAEDPFDRLIDYVRLAQEFLQSKLLILAGVRGYFTQDEVTALCRDLAAAEMPVLFIDSVCYPMIAGEVRLVLDTDYCELLLT